MDLGLGIFTEILTSQSGFACKPDPEAAMYLMEKYGLVCEQTYYIRIGAWILTLQEIARFRVSILLTSDYQGNHQMNTLIDIPAILNAEKNL